MNFKVKEISFDQFDQWKFTKDNEKLVHSSGKFFQIKGIRIKTNFNSDSDGFREWDQPIINQPEIGILGIICKEIDGIIYYLMQHKIEPGNINGTQLSPTVQATKSNFTQVHEGKKTAYLEYFIDPEKSRISIDQLQSEQGGKFLRKRNRNMVVWVDEEIEVLENFEWMTMNTIQNLLNIDNAVNMDARSVISTLSISDSTQTIIYENPLYTMQELWRWYIDQKVKYELSLETIPLSKLKNWKIEKDRIYNSDDFFSVIGIQTDMQTREIASWTQPMIKDINEGFMGFIKQYFKETAHYLVQAKVMPGNIDIIDISPTVSFSNWRNRKIKPSWFDFFFYNSKTIYETIQSEEGGRFYHIQNRNIIVETTDIMPMMYNNYTWMTHRQLMSFMPYGMLNMETRSLIAAM